MLQPASSTDRLTVTLPSDREILITRVFNAPAKLVFTNPKSNEMGICNRAWKLDYARR